MAWIELNSDEYAKEFANPHACYLRADFNLLNAPKVDAVRFFAFASDADSSGYRLGFVVGERGDEWSSPYSAPFGGFICSKGVATGEIDEAILALPAFVSAARKKLHVTFPPSFYNQNFLTKCISSVIRAGFTMRYVEINHALDFTDAKPYEKRLWNMAKRNLKQALKCPYEFREETTPEGMAACYEVIRKNRVHRGFPLRMSLEALKNTAAVVPIHYYSLNLDGVPVSSSIVYNVAPKISQVIYWGDAPGFDEYRPMNLLAFKMFELYKSLGMDYLDIGISTEFGVPNVGLCSFKESIGCFAELKYSFDFDGTKGA